MGMRLSPAILAAAVLLSGCGLDKFNVDLDATATVPGNPAANAILDALPFGASFQNVNVLDQKELRDAGVDAGDIDSARLRALRLEVQSGDALETWLESVAFYVEADGEPRVRVAHKEGIGALPAGTTAIDLEVDPGVELKPYVSKPMTLSAEVTGKPPAQDTTIKSTATVRVDAAVSNFL